MSHRRLLTLLAWMAIVAPLVAEDVPARDHDPDWMAPLTAAAKANPFAKRTDASAGGQKVFQQRCSTCHGEDGRGSSRAPDLTRSDVQAQTDGALFWKISGGNTRAGMPAFSFLPEAQRWQLVLRVRSMGGGEN